eukprot:4591620-Amphidinium_carterae.1
MVAELRLTIAEQDLTMMEENIFDNDDWHELNHNMVTTIRKDSVTFHLHKTTNNTIAMMGKMNIKLTTPTQFDGKFHNSMYGLARRSIETIDINKIQDDYTSDDVTRLRYDFLQYLQKLIKRTTTSTTT